MDLNCPSTCPFINRIDRCGQYAPIVPDGKKGAILAIGEAPGADEVKQGFGFAGIAGKNLTQALEQYGVHREQWGRSNIVWCRPVQGGKNRKPNPAEIKSCHTNLLTAIDEFQPKIILAVGSTAAQSLSVYDSKTDGLWLSFINNYLELSKRDELRTFMEIPVIPMPHSSPLAWNRYHENVPIKKMGHSCVKMAVEFSQ